ncbi:MAG: LapA family protein [Pseudomonadota bacterium]
MRFIRLLIAAIAAIYLIYFAVLNLAPVDVVLYAHAPSLTLRVWEFALICVFIGALLGWLVTWLGGMAWRGEAGRAKRVLDAQAVRRQMAEQREEQRAAQQAAERRATVAAAMAKEGTTTALPSSTPAKPLALPST